MSMRNTVSQTCSYDVMMAIELTAEGFELVGFRGDCEEPHFGGRVTIENIIDEEVANTSIMTNKPARGCLSEGHDLLTQNRRLNEDGIADLIDYRDMLLRGIARIDQYILEIGDE